MSESVESHNFRSASRSDVCYGKRWWRSVASRTLGFLSVLLLLSNSQSGIDRICPSRLGCFGGGLTSVWGVETEAEREVPLTCGVGKVGWKSANGKSGLPEFSTLHLHGVVLSRGLKALIPVVFPEGLGGGVTRGGVVVESTVSCVVFMYLRI